MAKQPTVYIETTIPNYVFNENYPDEQKVAKLVFETIDKNIIKGFISLLVEEELKRAPTELKPKLLSLIKNCRHLKITREINKLVSKYIKKKCFRIQNRLTQLMWQQLRFTNWITSSLGTLDTLSENQQSKK